MNEPYDCGLIIKNLREKANMTQRELGSRINRDKGIISRYENNYQPVPFETMRTFAAIFNVSMDYLAGMEKPNSISISGLTSEQIDVLRQLTEAFRAVNSNSKQELSQNWFETVGRIVVDLFKNDSWIKK